MICKNCGKNLTWAEEMANMSLRDKATDGFCKDCRYKITKKILEDKKKAL